VGEWKENSPESLGGASSLSHGGQGDEAKRLMHVGGTS
jgi:hypothetical protein